MSRPLPCQFAERHVVTHDLKPLSMAQPIAGRRALRQRGKTRHYLPCLHEGLKAIPRERRRPRDQAGRLAFQLEAIAAAAEAGLKDHDRWLTAKNLLARKLSPAAA